MSQRLQGLARVITPFWLAALVVCSCGGSSDDHATATPGAGDSLVIVARDRHFAPENLSIPAGVTSTITFQNESAEGHTLTVYLESTPGGTVVADTGLVGANDSGQAVVLFASGSHAFRCNIHPEQMRGVISVR